MSGLAKGTHAAAQSRSQTPTQLQVMNAPSAGIPAAAANRAARSHKLQLRRDVGLPPPWRDVAAKIVICTGKGDAAGQRGIEPKDEAERSGGTALQAQAQAQCSQGRGSARDMSRMRSFGNWGANSLLSGSTPVSCRAGGTPIWSLRRQGAAAVGRQRLPGAAAARVAQFSKQRRGSGVGSSSSSSSGAAPTWLFSK